MAALGHLKQINNIPVRFAITGGTLKGSPGRRAGSSPLVSYRIPKSMLDPSAQKALQCIAKAGDYYINTAPTNAVLDTKLGHEAYQK